MRFIKLLVLAGALWVIVSCATDRPSSPGTARQESGTLKVESGDSQYAAPGFPVPVRPAVKFSDEMGNPIQGVEVVFAVTEGGGSATGTHALSDSSGVARVGSWTLGPSLGTNTMSAVVPGVRADTIVFRAIALCDCWKARAALNASRTQAGSAVLDGKLYVIGGLGDGVRYLPVEVYDPDSDRWTALDMLRSRYEAGIVALNSELYIVDGWQDQPDTFAFGSYDPVARRWTSRPAPPTPRYQLRAAVVDGILYAIGGIDWGRGWLGTLEAYDPATETWTTRAPMLTARRYMSVAVVDGIIYVIGGEGRGDSVISSVMLSSVEAYDPQTNSWTARAPLPKPLVASAAGVLNGIIYVTGGAAPNPPGEVGPSTSTTSVYAYDPAKNEWRIQPPMPTARFYPTATAFNGFLYVISGTNPWGGLPVRTVEAFKPQAN